jgi:long-chain acyl-CoA synthetase
MSEARTLVEKIRGWAEKSPERPALYGRHAGRFVPRSWRAYWTNVRTVGRALMALGHRPGEAVALAGRNRPEWLESQFGIMAVQGAPAAIYATNTAEQTAYVVRHSRSRLAIMEDAGQYEKLASQRGSLGALERVILWDDVPGRDRDWTLTWEEFLALAPRTPEADLEARLAATDPDATAFLCYTSGTTGEAKGVMLSNANLVFMARVLCERFGLSRERVLSYLPLCHMAEQLFTNLIQLETGGEVFFCEEIAKLRDYLPEVRPTIFLGVPRVWEKLESALRARLAEASGLKRRLAAWALATELRCFRHEVETGRPADPLARRLANRLVISKVKEKLGLDRVRLAGTGAAPISVRTLEFFASLGVRICEGYGMSETSALLTTVLPDRPRFGTVGRPFPGIEIKIAEDGEILARGPNLTRGYLYDEAKTEELWAGGWLHTGDIGQIDEEGNLRITDRKKDLFKTSGGKYVAPQAIEALLKRIPGVSQAVAIGDGRKYITALLTIDAEAAPKVAAELGIAPADPAALANDERFRAHIERAVAAVNEGLARYEQVKRFALLPHDFSVAGGEMTPTLKIKRKVVTRKYAAEIEALYADDTVAAG